MLKDFLPENSPLPYNANEGDSVLHGSQLKIYKNNQWVTITDLKGNDGRDGESCNSTIYMEVKELREEIEYLKKVIRPLSEEFKNIKEDLKEIKSHSRFLFDDH